VLLYLKRSTAPLVTVNGLRGTVRSARSTTPLYYSDRRVTFRAGPGYRSLYCVRQQLRVVVVGTVAQARKGVDKGATFTLTISAERQVGGRGRGHGHARPTYRVSLAIVERRRYHRGYHVYRYDATYNRVQGAVSPPILTRGR